MRSIPVASRQRILHLYGQNKSTREIAEYLGFCVAAVRRVRQQFKARGTLEPRTHLSGRKTLLTAERKASLLKLVDTQPDATLAELGARLDRPFRTSTVDLWLNKLGLAYKKNAFRRRAAPPGRGRKKGAVA
jgi:transposase